MQHPGQDPHKDPKGEAVHDSNYYGAATGVAGLLIGLGLIAFMFALADGFA